MKTFALLLALVSSAHSIDILDSGSIAKSRGFLMSRPELETCVEAMKLHKIDSVQSSVDSSKIQALESKIVAVSNSASLFEKAYSICDSALKVSKEETKKSRSEGEQKAKDSYWTGVKHSSFVVLGALGIFGIYALFSSLASGG